MAADKPRSIFEDVAEGAESAARAPAPDPRAAEARKRENRDALSLWMTVIAAATAFMVLIGGATRLTDSGLSITEWNVVTGILPPLSYDAWMIEFDKYKQIPEYQQQNFQMSLEDFKVIYYWEWGHRLLGRIVGALFIIPCLFFAMRKQVPTGWMGRFLIVGGLIGLQGLIGWWMVHSGVDTESRIDVAPYRLATHLGLAFVIFGLASWFAWRLRRADYDLLAARRRRIKPLVPLAGIATALVFLQVLLGALVAGLDAGRQYSDWPMMGGQFFPSEGFGLTPAWHNFFEDPATTQFNHRILAYIATAFMVFFWLKTRRSAHRGVKNFGTLTLLALIAQVILGIVTVLNEAPLALALGHQLLALLLFYLTLRTKFEISYPTEERIGAA